MKRLVCFGVAMVMAAAIGTVSPFAQDQTGSADGSVLGMTDNCTYPFGGGNLAWCVSNAGNLASLRSPAGVEQMNLVDHREGYVLCTPTAAYWSLGAQEGNWGAPILLSLTAASVTIRRTTSDGRFQLDQKWTRDNVERDVTVTMSLRNLSGGVVGPVFLARWAMIGASADPNDDFYDKSIDSLWARDAHGVTGTPLYPVSHSIWIGHIFFNATCNAQTNQATPGFGQAIFSSRFNLGNINNNGLKTAKYVYRVQ